MSQPRRRRSGNNQYKKSYLRLPIHLVTALCAALIIIGGTFVFALSQTDAQLQIAAFTNPNNPSCPYKTSLVEAPTEPRMETSIDLDLSQNEQVQFVELTVPSSQLALLTDGRILEAEHLVAGNSVYMTGDGIGVVESVEHQLYTPEPLESDSKGNGYRRVIGKSGRFVETMLYLYTESELVKTTPVHPFYVNSVWVEAQNLQPGDKIRTKIGEMITVVRTERRHQLFTLDNRRLYVFQQAGLPINTIPATAQEIANDSFKFTTKNGGTSIRVRGGG